MNYRFEQLVNLNQVRKLLESHNGFSNMAYGLFDTDENNLMAVGWQDICTQFHRVHPVSCARCRESNAYLKAYVSDEKGQSLEYRCKNGMVNLAIPIMVEDKHMVTFLTGQFFYEDELPDRVFFVKQAEELGFDQELYLAALDRVPVFSREHIRSNIQFLHNMVELLAVAGLANLMLEREVEERKQAEESLLKREAELQQQNEFQNKLLSGLQNADVVFCLAEGGRITYCNDTRFGEPFGLTEADMAAQPEFINLVHPDDRPRIAEIYQRRSAGEPMPTNFEVGVQWANGERREAEVVVSVVGYDPLKTLIIYKDITERKNTEARLHEMQGRLATIFATIPDLVWLKDVDGAYLACNAAFEEFSGASEPDLIGRTDYDLMDVAQADCCRKTDRDAIIAGGVCVSEEEVIYATDGRRVLLEIRKVPVFSVHGKVAGVMGIARDITERKRMEQVLFEREQEFHTLVENTPDPIFRYDRDCCRTYLNPAAQRLLGIPASELVGRSPVNTPLRWSVTFYQEMLRKVLESGEPTDFELTLQHADRSEFLHVRLAPEFDRNGQINGVLAIGRDITERKQIEEELQAKNSELERFTYTVSHDLKSPVITIKSFSGAIKHDFVSGRYDRLEKDLDRICTAADKMTTLLDDLLKLSRSGKIIDAPEPVDMAALVGSMLINLDGSLKENKVQVVVQPGLPTVMCDRQRMLEVLQNLVENAVKYRGDQPEPRIEIGLREDGDRQVFFVQDNGPGVDPKYHENIFGLFNRLETKIPGTGVGLALVKRIIETHGGRVWVESDGQGNGSTFCFMVAN